jgi:hypothetical protein
MDSSPPREAPWQSGLRGARANVLPGIALQLLALALVLGYYDLPEVHRGLARLAQIHQAAGVGFGAASTALFAGLLPFLYIRLARRGVLGHARYGWIQGLSLMAFWAYKGVEVDLWYRLQAQVVGSGHEASTIVLKVLLDQFVYCPGFAVPNITLVYEAVEVAPDWAALRADLKAPGWYRRRVLPILISNLGVWLPAAAVIYCLPTPLQLPLENLVLCFYTLILMHQTRTAVA